MEREYGLRKFFSFSVENARDHHFLCIINPIYDFFMKFRDPKIYAVEIHSKDPLRKVSSPFEYLYEYSYTNIHTIVNGYKRIQIQA